MIFHQVDEPATGKEANFCHPVDKFSKLSINNLEFIQKMICIVDLIKKNTSNVFQNLRKFNLKVDVHYATRGLQGWPKLWVQVLFMVIELIMVMMVNKVITMSLMNM